MNEDNGIAWRQTARGLNLVGFGTFLFLTTWGVLPWSFWADALTLWPILLVALGLRLTLERWVRWAAVVSPLVIIGTLCVVALRGQPEQEPPGEWRTVRAERQGEPGPWTFDGDFFLARLDLQTKTLSEDVYAEGRVATKRKTRVRIGRRRGTTRVRIGTRGRTVRALWRRRREESWQLVLNDRWPLRAEFDLAFTDGRVDLSTAPVARVRFDGAFNDLELRLGTPDADTRIDLEGAFNDLTITVPEDVPVEVRVDGPLNAVDNRGGSAREGPGYRVEVDGAFNSVTVRSPFS